MARAARVLLLAALLGAGWASVAPGGAVAQPRDDARFATFNASLNRAAEGELVRDLSDRDDAQARAVAEIIQRTRPDVLLVNEFDYDERERAAELFQDNYLSVSQKGARPIEYRYSFVAPSNTGVPSGFDLDNSGTVGGPGDALGFGFFPGQFGMLVLSRHPIERDAVRTFRDFRWKDMPGALLPDDRDTSAPRDFYSDEELEVLPLSSKSHWDVPIRVGARPVHFLVSHPTPPVFDGPEDRNGRRNSDEIRFWADYIGPGRREGRYIYDDQGRRGGLRPGAQFVIAGDQNADPFDGDSRPEAIRQLLDEPLVNTRTTPDSPGGPEQARLQGGVNAQHRGDPAFDTADFAEPPGNLRVDYVLPRRNLRITDAGVFWPRTDDPLFRLVGTFPFPSSDHRMVWLDLAVAGRPR
ncbi:MAG: endonuclease/exonuclease/phosphatase family protein [Solirubrobacteraceae bacterium MAG38_C4-C5]|nr:endonuclease/exonuclease/phosphatase family protein [Candidatus Siliceabacter maunaloa]